MWVSDFSIGHRATVFVLLVIIVVSGVQSYLTLPREAAPDISIPNILVNTFYEGVSPADIESLITVPLERKLTEIGDIKEMNSTSAEGSSIINIEFNPEVDIDAAMQKVRDKVDLAKPDLPNDLEDDPAIEEINLSEFPIMTVVAYGPIGLVRLKEIADDLEDEIEVLPGVLNATVIGGIEREITVEYDPQRLSALNLDVTRLMTTVTANNITTPGGSVEIGEGKYLVKVPGEFVNPAEASSLVVLTDDGHSIYLNDLAVLNNGYEERQTISRLNRQEAVSISVQKRTGENIIAISDSVKKLLEETRLTLPDGVQLTITTDMSKDIRMMVSDLESSILTGLLLVLAVVFMAIGIRNAVLVSIAIPCSLLITFSMLQVFGITLNMVVLFSLVLAVGMLVDNAIVIVENVFRHGQEGKGRIQAAIDATREVATPVIASTLTTVGAFLPMVFWPGIVGEFMSYLPVTVIITLSASLAVALVITPALASLFIKPTGRPPTEKQGPILTLYRWVLTWSVDNPGAVMLVAVSVMVGVIGLYADAGNGVEFFPDSDPKRAFVDVRGPVGMALDVSDRYVRRVEEETEGISDIVNTVANVGSGAGSANPMEVGGANSSHRSRVAVEFKDRELREVNSREILVQLRERLADIVGADIDVRKEDEGPPTGAPVNIEITGEDYAALADIRKQIVETIRSVPGLVNLRDDYRVGRPEVRVIVDKERAALFGLNTQVIGTNIQAAIRGIKAGVYRDGNDEYDILVRLPRARRESLDALKNLQVLTLAGAPVPLSSVADIELSAGFGSIERVDRKRVITVMADTEGRLSNDVLADVQERVAGIELPRGYHITYTGQNKEQDEASEFLSRAFMLAIFLIALVLVTQFNSVMKPVIVLSSVMLSMMGVFIGLLVLKQPFGIIMTGIGVISLAGVVVNNAIILIDYIVQLRREGVSNRESLIRAGLVRFRPVMLTAITTILGLLPMAIGVSFNFRTWEWVVGSESSQWWGSMATAVAFGLGVATLLTLLVIPCMMALQDSWMGFAARIRGRFAPPSVADSVPQPAAGRD